MLKARTYLQEAKIGVGPAKGAIVDFLIGLSLGVILSPQTVVFAGRGHGG